MKELVRNITNISSGYKICAPKWIVFMIDLVFSIFAAGSATFISMQFKVNSWRLMIAFSLAVVTIRTISFLMARTYSGIVRYTGTKDILRIFYTVSAGEVAIILLNVLLLISLPSLGIPFVYFWIEYSILLCLMVFSRLVFKILFADHFKTPTEIKRVIVYGNSEYLLLVKKVLSNTVNESFQIAGFIETDDRSAGKYLSGIRLYSIKSLKEILAGNDIDHLIIAQQVVDSDRKKEIVDVCMAHKVSVKEIPSFEKLINGSLTFGQLKNLNIEDLLERDPINLSETHIAQQLKGKTILVTGAAGSIGSEIVRQLIRFQPSGIILVDIAETQLYDLELELIEKFGFKDFQTEMSDVRDHSCMDRIFRKYQPDIVYHAAAYKHVPMIEKKPLEGVKTNIFGTKNIADLAVKYECDKFVMVSTDKAVNPTNVMGCTKRIAEIYTQSLNAISKTAFITTRFGNVLGSNGSVIPRFVQQIEHGGPVTVTHPKITRFFMTIPEACQLVLQAGILGEGGEIFVFDMGESVKIVDLAKKMILLSGYDPGTDIKIVYTGLRPGEKLYEEVLSDKEKVLPTLHNRINRARVREYDFYSVRKQLFELKEQVEEQEEIEVVRFMKKMVPEFKSQNSVFEIIDQKSASEQIDFISKNNEPITVPLVEQKQAAVL